MKPPRRSVVIGLSLVVAVVAAILIASTLARPLEPNVVVISRTPTSSPMPTASAAAVVTPPTSIPSPAPAPYVNTEYKFSVALPQPYRKSARLSLATTGGRPAAQDAFTARSEADEVAAGQSCGNTSCATWNFVAVVEVWPSEASTGTPREWYQRYSFSAGERIQDVTVDGRPAVRIDGGATYGVQYVVRDGVRILRVAYLIYPPDFGPTPTGASKDKLEAIVTSFRFTL